MVKAQKKCKVAWGITGGGDKIAEIVKIMLDLKKQYEHEVEIHVFVSKNGETMLRFYRQFEVLKAEFSHFTVEMNPNAPFLASWLQSGRYDFFFVAPTSSNTVAKIANSIGDTLITNSVIMSLKAFGTVYLFPTDYRESIVETVVPNGKTIKIQVRKEEADQIRRLEQMEGMHVFDTPEKIRAVFEERYNKQ
ncbi:MAG: archaeoflavoprotein AfpA [Candidatus Bathyarchaeota archaeon]|jgi:archaeoflavoprotein AfpA|nr:archaeoflavoprotein AfpA [Candidatus Termiticorpusculum sp.]MCL1970657.1 archaeoflavoprotein AfpA [Candidatus Termiticorpusculum sp.]MDR2548304.1 archaeoflavoprotein AfpA [Rickettsiales bacterium]